MLKNTFTKNDQYRTPSTINKFAIQDEEYQFPYHHIPNFHRGKATPCRTHYMGLRYMAMRKHILDMVEGLSPKSVLDVGCGDGAYLCELLRYSSMQNTRMTGIDLSERAISLARGINPDIDFRVKDVLAIADKYDCIICNQVLEHVPDEGVPNFLLGIANALAHGGTIFLTVPSVNLPLDPKHYRHYNLDLLIKSLESCPIKLRLEKYEFIAEVTRLHNIYMSFTCNRFINLRISAFDDALYSHILKTIVSTPDKGANLLAIIKVDNK